MRAVENPLPSMYQRRLRLIAVAMLAAFVAQGVQLVRLTIAQGPERRAVAEEALERRAWLPTYRGRILDRHGRVLALDRPGYALAVEYPVITGAWELDQARAEAKRLIGAGRWALLDPSERDRTAEPLRPAWRARVERLMSEIRLQGRIDEEQLEARFDAIRADVQRTAAAVWARQRERWQQETGPSADAADFKPEPIVEQESAHVVLPHILDEVAFAFRSLADELPDMFEVVDARVRTYPWHVADVPLARASLPRTMSPRDPIVIRVEGVADHILGAMRDVQAQDMARRPFLRPASSSSEDRSPAGAIDLGGYRPLDDTSGSRGIERAFEDHLRGRLGLLRTRFDGQPAERVEPVPGGDVRLTIDVELQARVQAILSPAFGLTRVQAFHQNPMFPAGWALDSAAVVIDVESGEILALASEPTFTAGESMDADERTLHQPFVNRPVEAIYPPGSIVKPLVLCAAVGEGVHRLGEQIACTGHYFPNVEKAYRCWIYRDRYQFATHQPLAAQEALARSCNIFFYTLADRLGLESLTEWYAAFGAGRALEIGLAWDEPAATGPARRAGESAGMLPGAERFAALALAERRGHAVSLGIGQGEIAWTPLHAANAYATLARGGVVRDATIIADEALRARLPRRTEGESLALDTEAVETALAGLRDGVTEAYGSGHHIAYDETAPESGHAWEPIFNGSGVTVRGKTGTAEAPPLRLADTNGDGAIGPGDEAIEGLDHAWFVGLVAPEGARRPMYAIAVIVEKAGSGGRSAGPVANQIIHALQDEGYLPGAADAAHAAEGGAR